MSVCVTVCEEREGGRGGGMEGEVSVELMDVSLSVCGAVWSWTSSSRRTSCCRWWRGCAPRRTPTSPLCLTPRRPTPPPPNASPKQTPRSTRAGNSGSCEKRYAAGHRTTTRCSPRPQHLCTYPIPVISSRLFLGGGGGQKNGIYPAVWWPSNR